MKRAIGIVAVLAAAVVVAVLAIGASNDDNGSGTYRVRAIFDSAFSVIPGEDVKIAGVKVGKITALSVTDDNKAAVVMDIDKAGFGDWRQDATCQIRPQSLIGEKFVECTPTEPRGEDEQAPPPLKKIESGPGEGEFLLPVTNTLKTVDLDLINSIYQLPERQRLTIILNEFGTGLAGRGGDLNEVIRRANPALMETDKSWPSSRSRTRSWPTWPRSPTPRWRRWPRSAPRSPTSSRGPRTSTRRPPSTAARWRTTSRSCPSSCGSCARRWSGWAS